MSGVLRAFLFGVLSASSLGLGAFTARIWKPTNFILGLLTAFGAGALLSAVTIDIVAPAVESGNLGWWLVAGAVVGGLAFEVLNRAVNARGGFLRKASTSITFLRDREHRRRRQILDGLERIDIFEGLPDRELDAIAKAFRTARFDADDVVYRAGDLSQYLNVLAEGEVTLETPGEILHIRPFQAFGHLAFVAGTTHRSTATATADSEVLRLNRNRLRSVLEHCEMFGERLRSRVHSDDLMDYVRTHHPNISEDHVASWIEEVESDGIERLPQLLEVAASNPTEQIIDHLEDVGPFRDAPRSAVRRVAQLMFREEHEAGHVFFRPGEPGDRMYVVADGDVALVELDASLLLHGGEEFGSLSFVTGMRHSSTAIAQSETEVWVLQRSDLEELLATNPGLRATLGDFLRSHRVAAYLETDHGLERDKVAGYLRRAQAAIRRGRLPKPASASIAHGAPLAIWLGLLLDAIPESLVIGATADVVRVSFLAGIFLSNYPESLASSVGMREQAFAWRSIGLLWGSVVLVTGVGAAIGSVVFQSAPEQAFAVVEGLAAGAMLTVITQTMMPEALHRSGGFVGLAALAGFLFTTLIGA